MRGSGTQQNPYIVYSWSEFEQINIPDSLGKYVVFATAQTINALKFSTLHELGLLVYPNVNWNGSRIVNLYIIDDSSVISYGVMQNLSILNMYYNGDAESIFSFYDNVDNIVISGLISVSGDVSLFDVAQDKYISNCTTIIKGNAGGFTLLHSGDGGIIQSNINLSIVATDSAGVLSSADSTPVISRCRIKGEIISTSITGLFVNSNTFSSNVYDLLMSGTVTVPDDGANLTSVSIYNSDKLTVSNAGLCVCGCTTEQITDVDYLHSKFFPSF